MRHLNVVCILGGLTFGLVGGGLACQFSNQPESTLAIGGTPMPLTVSYAYFHSWEVSVEPNAEYEILLEFQNGNVDLQGARLIVLDSPEQYLAASDSSLGANVLTFVGPEDGAVTIQIAPPVFGGDDYRGEFTIQIIRLP